MISAPLALSIERGVVERELRLAAMAGTKSIARRSRETKTRCARPDIRDPRAEWVMTERCGSEGRSTRLRPAELELGCDGSTCVEREADGRALRMVKAPFLI